MTRSIRKTAIKRQSALAMSVLSIQTKRADRRPIRALPRAEIQAIFAAPDLSTPFEARHHAMQLPMYNTGARVAAITIISCTD